MSDRHLEQADLELFFKLSFELFFYINQKLKIISNKKATTLDSLMNWTTAKEKTKIRNAIYENLNLIDSFCQDNPGGFSQDELLIVAGWKKFLKGRFYILKLLKDFAVFLDDKEPTHVYGVKALRSDFDEAVGFRPFPVLVSAVLLPFKNHIVYDGLFNIIPIVFGTHITADLNDTYQEIKAKSSIITNLVNPEADSSNQDADGKMLKYYLKNNRNRDLYHQEINRLAHKSQNLKIIYYQEKAKWNSRKIARD